MLQLRCAILMPKGKRVQAPRDADERHVSRDALQKFVREILEDRSGHDKRLCHGLAGLANLKKQVYREDSSPRWWHRQLRPSRLPTCPIPFPDKYPPSLFRELADENRSTWMHIH